jgi:hypothetical protein
MTTSTCPATRADFRQNAQPVEVTINGIPMTLEVKYLSTGSLGRYLNGKTNVICSDRSVTPT